jgi:hypothetical protein
MTDVLENAIKRPKAEPEVKSAQKGERHGRISSEKAEAPPKPKSRVHTVVFQHGVFVVKDSAKRKPD